MRVHDLADERGRVFAFEVSNTLIGRAGVRTIVDTIPGAAPAAADDRLPDREIVCAFEVDGQRFLVLEPFGDSSRFWVGPEPARWCTQLEVVRRTSCGVSPWSAFARRVAGPTLSTKLLLFAAFTGIHWAAQFIAWAEFQRSPFARGAWTILASPFVHAAGALANTHFWFVFSLNSICWGAAFTWLFAWFLLKR